MAYDGNNKRHWSVSREISISDLVILLSTLAGVMVAYAKLDIRIALIEQASVERAMEAEKSVKRAEQAVEEINRKLDRLIEQNRR